MLVRNQGLALCRRLCIVMECAGLRTRHASSVPDGCAASEQVLAQLQDPSLVRGKAYIGGQWLEAADKAKLEVFNPATGEVIATVPECKGADTNAAIVAAAAAAEAWAGRTGKERSAVLRRWYEEVRGAREDITRLMTLECGKPLAESRGEFDSGVASIEWFAEEAKRSCGDVLETTDARRRFLTLRHPVGIVGAITPWNFPMSMITRKVSPALAAGCTVVLKPSELTPLTALALAELGERAGIPAGVLSVLCGDAPAIGDALMKSNEVIKLPRGCCRFGRLLSQARRAWACCLQRQQRRR